VVTLLDPYTLNLLRRYDVIDAEALRATATELGPGVTKWHRRIYWIGVVVGLYSVGSALFSRVRSGGGLRFLGIGDAAIVFLFIVLFGGLYLYMHGARRRRMRRVRDVMVRHLRCPHCGYDIRGLPTAPEDGATVCPECGCAWRLADASTDADQRRDKGHA
jgi:hypothetical protein